MANFEPAFQKTLRLEGGYSDDPLIGAAGSVTGSARRRPEPMVIRARWRRCRSTGRGGFTRPSYWDYSPTMVGVHTL